jgi:hypothetical protein
MAGGVSVRTRATLPIRRSSGAGGREGGEGKTAAAPAQVGVDHYDRFDPALFGRDAPRDRQYGLAPSALVGWRARLTDVPIFPSSEEDRRLGEEAAICPGEKASSVDAPSRMRSGTKMSTSLTGGLPSVVGGLASWSPKTVVGISAT